MDVGVPVTFGSLSQLTMDSGSVAVIVMVLEGASVDVAIFEGVRVIALVNDCVGVGVPSQAWRSGPV